MTVKQRLNLSRSSRSAYSFWIILLWLTLALLLLIAGGSGVVTATPDGAGDATLPDGAKVLMQIWQKAEASGSYRFTAEIEQMIRPRPVPAMIGQTSQRLDLRLEGEVTWPDQADLRLQSEDATTVPPLHMIQSGNQAFIEINGELQPVQDCRTLPAVLAIPLRGKLPDNRSDCGWRESMQHHEV